jgi:hypothetical protein
MSLDDILTIIGIISPFVLIAVWLASLSIKTSNKVLAIEISLNSHKDKITVLEKITTHDSIEKVVEKVVYNIFNSPQFKEAIKGPIESAVNKSVRDTMIHINKNEKASEASAFEEILHRLKKLEKND